MAIPVLKLNLAPPPSLWRRRHEVLGWFLLCIGVACLALVLGFTYRAYLQARQAGQLAVKYTEEARHLARKQGDLLNQLRSIDVSREMPRWKLAERILTERSLPWSRLAAELERCQVQDVRLKSIQRTRDQGGQVLLKLKGESRSREAEVAFVEALRKNTVFAQVLLEREAERQGGGLEFDATLVTSQEPPPYEALPRQAQAAPGPKSSAPAMAPDMLRGGPPARFARDVPPGAPHLKTIPLPQPTPAPRPQPFQAPVPAGPQAVLPMQPPHREVRPESPPRPPGRPAMDRRAQEPVRPREEAPR